MIDHDAGAPSIQKADRSLRIQLLFFLVVMAVAGAGAILGMERYLSRMTEVAGNEPERAAREIFNLLRLCMLASGLGLLVLCGSIGRFSMKVIAEARFPPSGTRVVRDTHILTGHKARSRGWGGVVAAVIMLILGLALPWMPDLLLRPLLRGASEAPPSVPGPGPAKPAASSPEQQAAVTTIDYCG